MIGSNAAADGGVHALIHHKSHIVGINAKRRTLVAEFHMKGITTRSVISLMLHANTIGIGGHILLYFEITALPVVIISGEFTVPTASGVIEGPDRVGRPLHYAHKTMPYVNTLPKGVRGQQGLKKAWNQDWPGLAKAIARTMPSLVRM